MAGTTILLPREFTVEQTNEESGQMECERGEGTCRAVVQTNSAN